jgi:hypothetical protein
MPQPADFGRFYYDPASNLLAYCAVTAGICQRLPQPLRKVPTLANGLDAELLQNLPDLENLFLHRWMCYCMDNFLVEKRARDLQFRPNLPLLIHKVHAVTRRANKKVKAKNRLPRVSLKPRKNIL